MKYSPMVDAGNAPDNISGDMPMKDDGADAGESSDYPQITLDKSDPDIAEKFANCKEGDMYKVVKDDENEVTLQKMDDGDGKDAENADDTQMDNHPEMNPNGKVGTNDNPKTSDNPAILALIGKRVKH